MRLSPPTQYSINPPSRANSAPLGFGAELPPRKPTDAEKKAGADFQAQLEAALAKGSNSSPTPVHKAVQPEDPQKLLEQLAPAWRVHQIQTTQFINQPGTEPPALSPPTSPLAPLPSMMGPATTFTPIPRNRTKRPSLPPPPAAHASGGPSTPDNPPAGQKKVDEAKKKKK